MFVEGYVPPANAAYRALYEALVKQRALAPMVSFLNSWIRIPYRVEIVVEECGQANAFYIPAYRRISICYELLPDLYQTFQSDTRLADGVFWFVAYHELGHSLAHVLDLPITGREEDAADQLATLMLLAMGADGESAAVSAAIWFLQNARSLRLSAQAYADTHSLEPQRFFNITCWIYGSAPQRNLWIVQEGWLTRQRANNCPHEYAQTKRSWETLLAPYGK